MKNDPEENENDNEVFPDWSQIDAISIYRSSGATTQKAKQQNFKKVKSNTVNFLKIFISFIVAICLLVFISGR